MSNLLLSIKRPAAFNDLIKHVKPLVTYKNNRHPYFYLCTEKAKDHTYLTISATDGYRMFRCVYPGDNNDIVIHQDFQLYLIIPRLLPRVSETASLLQDGDRTILQFDNIQQDIAYYYKENRPPADFTTIYDSLLKNTPTQPTVSVNPELLKDAVTVFLPQKSFRPCPIDIRVSSRKEPIHITDGLSDLFVFPMATRGDRITSYSLLHGRKDIEVETEGVDDIC